MLAPQYFLALFAAFSSQASVTPDAESILGKTQSLHGVLKPHEVFYFPTGSIPHPRALALDIRGTIRRTGRSGSASSYYSRAGLVCWREKSSNGFCVRFHGILLGLDVFFPPLAVMRFQSPRPAEFDTKSRFFRNTVTDFYGLPMKILTATNSTAV